MEVSPEVQAKLDQIAKLPRAARAGVIGVVCTLLGVGYYFGIYQDSSLQLERLRAQELELQRKLSEVRSVAANISAFESEIADLEIKLKTALRQLPNKKELEVLLTDPDTARRVARRSAGCSSVWWKICWPCLSPC